MNLGIESEKLEFKKSTAELKAAMLSLCAMLNKSGSGTLFFGVKNNGDVIGQQIADKTLRDISQAVANFIKPQVIPRITVEFIDSQNVVKVVVAGREQPYSANGRYYMRSADEDREITPAQLRNLLSFGSDFIVNIESDKQDLTFNQLKTLYANANLTLHEETFRHNLNLYTSNGKYNLMANILADSNSFSIKVARFKGTDKTELIARNEYGFKCLLLALQQVLDYLEALNETSVELTGARRKEYKLFDFQCLREAWLNACLHNKWTLKTPPAVYFFADRIEIVSIGGLPPNLSLEEFYAGHSRPINLELQQIMLQLDYIEQTGHGVPLIVSRYGKQVFNITENFISVSIPLQRQRVDNSFPCVCERREQYADLSTTQENVLKIVLADKSITTAQIAAKINLSRTSVINALAVLKEKAYIMRVGAKKNGKWLPGEAFLRGD